MAQLCSDERLRNEDFSRCHLPLPTTDVGRIHVSTQTRMNSLFPNRYRVIHLSVPQEHLILEPFIDKGTNPAQCRLRMQHQIFVKDTENSFIERRLAEFHIQLNCSQPLPCISMHPGSVPTLPLKGLRHIASVSNQMDKLCITKHGGKRRNYFDISRRLISPPTLAFNPHMPSIDNLHQIAQTYPAQIG